MKVNLIETKKESSTLFIPIVCLIIVTAILSGYIYYQYTVLWELKKELTLLNRKIKIYSPYRDKYLQLRDSLTNLQLETSEIKWEKGIKELGYVVTNGVWLNELLLENYNLFIKGRANNREQLTEFTGNLDISPYYSDLDLKETIKDSCILFEVEAKLTGKE